MRGNRIGRRAREATHPVRAGCTRVNALLLDYGGFCILAEANLPCTSEVVGVTMTSWNAPSRMGVSQGTFWGLQVTF